MQTLIVKNIGRQYKYQSIIPKKNYVKLVIGFETTVN